MRRTVLVLYLTLQPANTSKLAYGFNALKSKTGSVMHTFKQTAVDQKALELQVLLTTVILAVKFQFFWC